MITLDKIVDDMIRTLLFKNKLIFANENGETTFFSDPYQLISATYTLILIKHEGP